MKKIRGIMLMIAVTALLFPVMPLMAQEEEKGMQERIQEDEVLQLNVQRVIEYLLRNNHDIKLALLEYKEASHVLREYNAQYDTIAFGSVGYDRSENANPSTARFQGDYTTTQSYAAGLSRHFSTGTDLSASVTSFKQNIHFNSPLIPGMGGEGYQTGIELELTQELVKNVFGYQERLTRQKLSNTEEMNKLWVRQKLAQLLMEAISGYWNVSIAEENLKTSRISYASNVDIRNLIARKLRLGLAEREDLLDWNSKVLKAQTNVDLAEKALFEAEVAVLQTLGLKQDLPIEIGTAFNTTPPDVTLEKALADAYLRRVDWQNQQVMLKNAELQYRIASNGELPSLQLKGAYGNEDYDTDGYANTLDDVNKQYSVSLEMTYPLGNKAADLDMRKARLELHKQKVLLDQLEITIRDEVRTAVKACDTTFRVYEQRKRSRQFAQNYYGQLYAKFNRGRYSAVELKLALDSYIAARYDELKSLVDYNVAILQRDIIRNMLFESLAIDIDTILKRVEE